MANMTFHTTKVINRQQASNAQNRLAILYNTNHVMGDMIRYTAAVDDDSNGFIGAPTNAYQEHASNSDNIPNRLLYVFSNNVGGTDSVSDRVFRSMENDVVSANQLDQANDVLDRFYRPGKMPNADILSWDSNQDDGCLLYTSPSPRDRG